MLNHITVMGRLTRDPELRSTNTGIPVASFTLAVERDVKDQAGDRKTDVIDVVAWRGTGEFAARNFHKGDLAVVCGRLEIRNWTDKDGGKRKSAEIVASNIYFTGGKKTDPQQEPAATYSAEAPGFADISAADDGDLPF